MNPQLYKWLAIINDKSSNNNIPQDDNTVNIHSILKTARSIRIKNNEAIPFKTASKTNIGLRRGTTSYTDNISPKENIVNMYSIQNEKYSDNVNIITK